MILGLNLEYFYRIIYIAFIKVFWYHLILVIDECFQTFEAKNDDLDKNM